ncbi:hypothetical protein SLA2020_276230 [Shorea laevis]
MISKAYRKSRSSYVLLMVSLVLENAKSRLEHVIVVEGQVTKLGTVPRETPKVSDSQQGQECTALVRIHTVISEEG